MAKDVSNKTIVILLILLLIVSLMGFWIVSDKIDNIKLYPLPSGEEEEQPEPNNTGTISLEILGEEPDNSLDEATGKVSLEILKNK